MGDPVLQLHLEPNGPIEVSELTSALGSLARQYEDFALANGLAEKAADARLLVSTVAPGSIDISLLPDWASAVVTAPLLASLIERYELIEKFGKRIKQLIELFSSGKPETGVTLRDCDDAINISNPIAQHGGSQTFNIVRDGRVTNVFFTDMRTARRVVENAASKKKLNSKRQFHQKKDSVFR